MELERCYELLAGVATGGSRRAIEPASDEESAAVLDLARVVAHSVERKAAPLVSYSMGRALAAVDAHARLAAIREAIARIEGEAEEGPPEISS